MHITAKREFLKNADQDKAEGIQNAVFDCGSTGDRKPFKRKAAEYSDQSHQQRQHSETERHAFAPHGSASGDTRPAYGSNNLPAPASDIVGRESHLRDVTALVTANRLVTLVGAGGIGKTRLAIELAHRLEPTFDSVWVVELASVSDPDRVQSAVASALGLGGGPISPAGLATEPSPAFLRRTSVNWTTWPPPVLH